MRCRWDVCSVPSLARPPSEHLTSSGAGPLLTRQNSVQPFGERLQSFGILRLIAGLFRDAPALIADPVEGFHDGRPIVVALEERHGEALGFAEFLDVQFEDVLAEQRNPTLGRVEPDDVADVEVPADPRAVDFVEITHRFLWLHDEIVPDLFDGDFYAQFLGQRDGLTNLLDRPL